MLKLHNGNKSLLKKHALVVSDKLSQLAREGKKRKLVIHDRKGVKFFEFPLLLVLVVTVLLPIFAGIAIWFLLLNNFNAVIEKMREDGFDK